MLSTVVSLVIWKYCPLYVLPPDSVASMVPETPSELFQLKVAAFAPDGVDPVPVPIVVQPAAIATSSGSITAALRYLISILLFLAAREIASVSTESVAAENRNLISCLARDIAAEIGLHEFDRDRSRSQFPMAHVSEAGEGGNSRRAGPISSAKRVAVIFLVDHDREHKR